MRKGLIQNRQALERTTLKENERAVIACIIVSRVSLAVPSALPPSSFLFRSARTLDYDQFITERTGEFRDYGTAEILVGLACLICPATSTVAEIHGEVKRVELNPAAV